MNGIILIGIALVVMVAVVWVAVRFEMFFRKSPERRADNGNAVLRELAAHEDACRARHRQTAESFAQMIGLLESQSAALNRIADSLESMYGEEQSDERRAA